MLDTRTIPLKKHKKGGADGMPSFLADAERWARETGYSFMWDIDHDSSSADWIDDDDEDGGKHNDPRRVWSCWMMDMKGNIVQSLHAIDFGRDGHPWGSNYRRVVEAELACGEWASVVQS